LLSSDKQEGRSQTPPATIKILLMASRLSNGIAKACN
jgi:hypothetical protein